jgi:hypothetical protein
MTEKITLPARPHSVHHEIRISNVAPSDPPRTIVVDYGGGVTVIPPGASARWVGEVCDKPWPHLVWVPK